MNLKEKRAAALKAAKDVEARAAGRELTTAELAFIDAKLDEVDALDKDLAEAKEAKARFNALAALDPGSVSDLGFDLSGAKGDLVQAVATKSSRMVAVDRKALGTASLSLPAVGQSVVGSTPGTAATSLRDVFREEQTDAATVRYYLVGAATGGPDIVAEGAEKPELGNTITPKDAALVKLAARFGLTTEAVDDAPFIVDQVLREALFAMLRRENKLIADTMAAASGVLLATGTKAAALDVLATAIGNQEALNGLSPDVAILNPADLAAIRSLKASGSGAYLATDPFTDGVQTIWGAKVLPTPAVTAGTIWLARKEALTTFYRGPVQITTGHNADDLAFNRVTTVVEERLVPVAVQPGLLTKVTLT